MNPTSRPLTAAFVSAVALSVSALAPLARAQTATSEIEVQTAPVQEQMSGPVTAEQIARQQEAQLQARRANAQASLANARAARAAGDLVRARAEIDRALAQFPNVETADPEVFEPVRSEAVTITVLERLAAVNALVSQNRFEDARTELGRIRNDVGDHVLLRGASQNIDRLQANPPLLPVNVASPAFPREQETINSLLLRGRSQYVAGDLDGAESSFRRAEVLDPENLEAKGFLYRIAQDRRGTGRINRERTRQEMLVEVARAWQRPGVINEGPGVTTAVTEESPLTQKLNRIIIPSVNFNTIELSRVVATLSQISEEFDTTGIGARGVNIVLLDNERRNPVVNIQLRNLTLRRVLDFITQSVNYQYEVQSDAIVIRPTGDTGQTTNLETTFFPVSRSAVTRMVGASGGSRPAVNDPFGGGGGGGGGGGSGEGGSIQNFLQSAGVDFANTPGAALAYDGAQLIVTQTTRNIERIRNILNRYTDVKQVEIATRFMEVTEGALDELGFNWQTAPISSSSTTLGAINTSVFNRTLAQTISGTSGSSQGGIFDPGPPAVNIPIDSPAPIAPGGTDLGPAGNLVSLVTSIGNFDVTATIRALSRRSGSDLLSEPKVTVLSGNTASIVVAQEFRYPDSYSEAQSQVSSGGTGGGGTAGVGATITAATPQDFQTRNVGVELTVTPTVEEDDYSISLDLNPRVTEFEGFVEYGGQNVAVSGSTIIRTPSGIFQPIFTTRSVQTRATVWDGATIVLGGLTREEVRRVNDRVPVLGNIPLLGRLFRSEGESSTKRNLLIFVTANLVSPGGSPKRQTLRGVEPSSLFQNPTLVTPGGSVSRRPDSSN
jgi:general secretion pathway protein D